MADTVLMTATVQPNTEMFVAQSDPNLRLRQYQAAIAAMRSGLSRQIDLVIVETSGADPAALTSLLGPADRSRTQVISFDPAESDLDRGKGRIEADAVRHAVSAIAASAGQLATVHKVTGRLIVQNASKVFIPVATPVVRVRSTIDRSFVDTRVISARVEEWLNVVLDEADAVDERSGVYLEHAVAAGLGRAAALQRIDIGRFPVRPRILGQSGTTGRAYRSGSNVATSVVGFLERGLAGLAAHKQV